jgi:hypothetical protein
VLPGLARFPVLSSLADEMAAADGDERIAFGLGALLDDLELGARMAGPMQSKKE